MNDVTTNGPGGKDNQVSWQVHGETNYLILSDSGKPLFARFGADEEVGQICGMISGLRSFILYDVDLQLGDLHSIEREDFKLVLWHIKGLIFVAIAARPMVGRTEAYLRFVLETLYCQLCFSLTQPVLENMMIHTNYDVSSILGKIEPQLHSILQQLELYAPYPTKGNSISSMALGIVHSLGGALQPLYPFSSARREQVSTALRETRTSDTLFSFIFARRGRLISLVQSRIRAMQMRTMDWSLLLLYLQGQSELLTRELWLPICLPRFNSSGFVYCYTRCLDSQTGLCVGFISHLGDQFQIFQRLTEELCTKLCIPLSNKSTGNGTSNQAQGSLLDQEETIDDNGSEDYVVVAAHGLVDEVKLSLDEAVIRKVEGEYLEVCQAFHFVFRYDVSLPRKFRQSPGQLPQCICASHEDHFHTSDSRRKVWSNYDKLMMRLRLGSAQNESIHDALEMIYHKRYYANFDGQKIPTESKSASSQPPAHAAVDAVCTASALFEAAPEFAGMTSIVEQDYLYVGINGDSFELYFCLSNELSVKQATALGAKLVRRLLMEKQQLFLWNPSVWK